MSKILIIAEHDGTALNLATAKCVSCAAAIGGEVEIAVFGNGIDAVAAETALSLSLSLSQQLLAITVLLKGCGSPHPVVGSMM